MIIENVMDELGSALRTVNGLRVHPYDEERITPPAALISLPTNVDYDQTYGRGSDVMNLLVTLLVSQAGGARTGRGAIAPYADGSGPKSIKKVLERHSYTSCDSVVVASSEFARIKFSEIVFLGVIFRVEITGQGG